MKKSINICALQMTSGPIVSENLAQVESLLGSVQVGSVDILVLPEMFAQFGEANSDQLVRETQAFDGVIGRAVKSWAVKHEVWIIAGTVATTVAEDKRPRARSFVVDDKGVVQGFYDKIHLFDALVGDRQGEYCESDTYSPGSKPTTVDSPWGKLGLSVCYDLRFAELYRSLSDLGAKVIFAPSAFTAKTGEAHWEVLCRARAIENGVYLIAVNQTGKHDKKRATWGHSMCVDPWGYFSDAGDTPIAARYEVDLKKVDEIRRQLPVNHHRRL